MTEIWQISCWVTIITVSQEEFEKLRKNYFFCYADLKRTLLIFVADISESVI